ncbi:MAG: hypothetical protein Fur002_02990 [Anaerolineales bacterium]
MSKILKEKNISGCAVQLAQGDITLENVDAIVNAANEYLEHGGGLAFAIVQRGGDVIQRESDEWVKQRGKVAHAAPAYTSGGALRAKFVIHAVGPIWGDGDEDAKLRAAALGALRLADELQLTSIALPAISTGIFGFPKARAARIILDAIYDYLKEPSRLRLIRITLWDDDSARVFEEAWNG